jgi:hypothetical protein
MQRILQDNPRVRFISPPIPLGKGIGWGIIGGLIATVVMDLILIGIFVAAGTPPFTCFSMIGDTIANLFSNDALAGSVPLGVAAHYLIGPLLGAFFGVAQRKIPALRVTSWKKGIFFAVLYAEIVSQPMLALAPLLLRMTASETLLWFGGSFGMHMIWGCVFGAVWGLRMRQPHPADQN